jgi:hypothetical protein
MTVLQLQIKPLIKLELEPQRRRKRKVGRMAMLRPVPMRPKERAVMLGSSIKSKPKWGRVMLERQALGWPRIRTLKVQLMARMQLGLQQLEEQLRALRAALMARQGWDRHRALEPELTLQQLLVQVQILVMLTEARAARTAQVESDPHPAPCNLDLVLRALQVGMARDRMFAQRPVRMMEQGLTLRLLTTLKTVPVLETLAMAILEQEGSLLVQEIDTVPDQAHHPQDRPAMTTTVKLVPVPDTPEVHPEKQQAMTTTTTSKLELDTPELVHPEEQQAMTTTPTSKLELDTPELVHPEEQQAMTTTTTSKLELDTPELVHQEQVVAAMAVMATSKAQDCQEGGRNPLPQEERAMLLKVGQRPVQQPLQTRRVMTT